MGKGKMTVFILATLFFVLNFADGILTFYLVCQEGISVELNPLMRWLMIYLGDWFILPKVLMGCIVALLTMFYWHRFKWYRILFMVILGLYFSMVAGHIINLCQLLIG
jgi:hypothetical protein